MLVRKAAALTAWAAAVAAISGCPSETVLDTNPAVPTGVLVTPDAFLGLVSCSARPGGMQSYVATLIDIADPQNPFTLPSSLPTSCSQPNDFRYVVDGDAYVAEIDGYELPASDLAPLGGVTSGSRHMLLVQGGSPVSPRWSGACGDAPGTQQLASIDTDVVLTPCDPLTDHQGAITTGVEIDPTASLGPFECGGSPGEVATFDVLPQGSSLMPQRNVPCLVDPTTTSTLTYDVGVQDDVRYTFTIVARDADNATLATAKCFATGSAGLVVLATCEALNP